MGGGGRGGGGVIVCGVAAAGTFAAASFSAPDRLGAPESAHRAAGWAGLGLSFGALGLGAVAVIRWGDKQPM